MQLSLVLPERRYTQAERLRVLEALYTNHYPRMVRLAKHQMPREADDAVDLVMDAYLSVAEKVDDVREDCLAGYWHRAVTNKIIDRSRSKKRRLVASIDECEESFGNDDRPSNVREAAVLYAPALIDQTPIYLHCENTEIRAHVRQCIEEVSPMHQEVLQYHYNEGLQVDEIAARIGIPVGTVKSRLKRGRRNVGARLERKLAA